MTTGMLIDGIAASEAIDSSGEILDVEGCDISDLEEGKGLLNWEHRGDDAPGASGLDIVGKIVFAKKIFKESDCDDARQRSYWNKIKMPFIYIVGRLYDGAGHVSAQALAAMIRDHVANEEPVLVRYSIEGSTLEKEGNRLLRCVARRVALTVKPCNRTCDSGLLSDPHAPDGFDKKPAKDGKDILDEVAKKNEHWHPLYAKLGGATEIETAPWIQEDVARALIKARIKEHILSKATAAGSYNAAPSALTGGAALQREDLGKATLINTAKAAVRDYRPDDHGDFRKFLKSRMPEASEDFIDHFADLVDDYKAKLRKADGTVPDVKGKVKPKAAPKKAPAKKAPAKKEPAKKAPAKKERLKEAPPVEGAEGKLFPPDHSKLPKPVSKTGESPTNIHWDPEEGKLYTEKATYALDVDPEHWDKVLAVPKFTEMFDRIHNNWRITHELLKKGVQIPGLRLVAALNGVYSANEQVPTQEAAVAHTLDMTDHFGVDPSKGKISDEHEQWLRERFGAAVYPDFANWYQENPHEAAKITTKAGPPRKIGKPEEKTNGLFFYHRLDPLLEHLLHTHRADGVAITDKLVEEKHAYELWKNRQRQSAKRAGESWGSRDDKLAYDHGPVIEGLSNKTLRYAVSMLGSGNVTIPDTHFARHAFGLTPEHPHNEYVKKVLLDHSNMWLLSAIDAFHRARHPAAHWVQHRYFGGHPDPQSTFMGFWAHWLNVGPHERAQKLHNTVYPNEDADHAIYYKMAGELMRRHGIPGHNQFLLKDEVPFSQPNMPMHVRVANAMKEASAKHGETTAQLLFWLAFAPALVPEEHKPRRSLLKSEALSVQLKAAVRMLRKDADERTPVVAKMPPADTGQKKSPTTIHMNEHGSTLNTSDEQKKLIHGIDMGRHGYLSATWPEHTQDGVTDEATWRNNAEGRSAFIKAPTGVLDGDFLEPHREVTYHNVARDFFGMGHYVPTTSIFWHNDQWHSAMEGVPGAMHVEYDNPNDPSYQRRAKKPFVDMLHQLGGSGELDKLAIMNTVMGNADRHHGNFVFTHHAGGPPLRMIDHGWAFKTWREMPQPPQYLRLYSNEVAQRDGRSWHTQPIHPAAQEWLAGLDENELRRHLDSNLVPEEHSNKAVQTLRALKYRVQNGMNTRKDISRA